MDSRHTSKRTAAHARRGRKGKVTRRWILFSCLGLLIIIIAGCVWVGVRALTAKSSLEAAVTDVKAAQASLTSLDTSKLDETYRKLHKNTSTAADMTSGWVWDLAEHTPFVGPNLVAFQQTAAVTNTMVEKGLEPVVKASHGVSIDSLKPVNGKIDLKPIEKLAPAVVKLDRALTVASNDVRAIDTSSTVDQLTDKVTELRQLLAKASGATHEIAKIVPLIAPALGSDQPRHYLMMFQGNSEVRALGGNPASMALIETKDGSISITDQYTSIQFENNRAESVAPLDPAVEKIYSGIVGRWIPNITSVPDFPLSAKLASAYVKELNQTKIDGVISFDPVALGYLLNVTGPVKLSTGDTLTGADAAAVLLNKVYFKYPEGPDADKFFNAAAASVFQVLTSGKGSPVDLYKALVRATNEGRLMYWSADASESKVIDGTRLAGTLPVSNAKATTIGAYFNDVTGSKMDFYVKATAAATSTQCQNDTPVFTEKVTLTNTLDPERADSLPSYISGVWYKHGEIATDVVVYGPVGAKISSWKSNGSAIPKAAGVIAGRPVSRILTTLKPGESITLTYAMTGAKGKYGPLEQRTTPMVWSTPTTVSSPGCVAAKK